MPSEQTHALDGWAHAFLLQFLHDYEGVGSGGGGVGRGEGGGAVLSLLFFFWDEDERESGGLPRFQRENVTKTFS